MKMSYDCLWWAQSERRGGLTVCTPTSCNVRRYHNAVREPRVKLSCSVKRMELDADEFKCVGPAKMLQRQAEEGRHA